MVSELFCMSMARVNEAFKHMYDIKVVAGVSESDSANVCLKYGVDFVLQHNNPIGKKWNQTLNYAIQKYDFDYLCIMGDDDIMSNELFHTYTHFIDKGDDHFGINQLYFIDSATKKAGLFKYQYPSKLVGCGRMISREAIEESCLVLLVKIKKAIRVGSDYLDVDQKTFLPVRHAMYLNSMKMAEISGKSTYLMWDEDIDKGLDNNLELRLLFAGFPPTGIGLPLISDVKTTQNMWSFDHLRELVEPVPFKDATEFFSASEKSLLEEIHMVNYQEYTKKPQPGIVFTGR